jgi:hypothetical protein
VTDPTLVDAEILTDLGLLEDEAVAFPPEEPSVPSIGQWDDEAPPLGYSDLPAGLVVISLRRRDYPAVEEAEERLSKLLEVRGLRVHDGPYWGKQFWYWRCKP